MSVFLKKDADTQKPKDSILLRKDQVSAFYELVVEGWENKNEIWALTHGPKILGAAGALSGLYGSMYFRRKLRLKHYGAVSMYLPNLILPYLLTHSVHMLVSCLVNRCVWCRWCWWMLSISDGDQWDLCKSVRLLAMQRNQSGCDSSGLWNGAAIAVGASVSVHVCHQTFHVPVAITA